MIQPAIKNKYSKFTIFFSLVLFIISFITTIYLALISHVKYKETHIRQWEQQLKTMLDISAINMQNYFTKFSQNLNYLTHDTIVQKWAYTGTMDNCNRIDCPLKNLYTLHKNEIDALVLLDSTGNVVIRYSSEGEEKNMMKKCCNNERNEKDTIYNKFCISDVFINISGVPSIIISYPLYYKNHFAGVLRWMVTIENISKQFIEPVKVGKKGYMFVIDKEHKIVAHHNKKFTGISVNKLIDYNFNEQTKSYIEENNESALFLENIKYKNEGKGKYIDLNKIFNIAVFKKFNIGDNNWTLIISMPYSEILNPLRKNALTTFVIAGAIIFITLIIVYILYKTQKNKLKLEAETKYLSEIAQAAEELKNERSKRLSAMIDGQEKERLRISRELHDGIGQHLIIMKMKLENEINKRKNENTEPLNEIKSTFVNTIDEIKRISDNLIPVILDEFGISTALKNLCDEIEKNCNIKIEFVSHGIHAKIDNKIQTYIYRMAQEGLNNIIKHSKATEANIQLLGNEVQVNLVIQDNGTGFLIDKVNKGNGLNNMRERIAILNGFIDIQSKINEGTIIIAKIPLR